MRKITRVRIFYQTDPIGAVSGGIDTFIRGIGKWAPEDIHVSMVGLSSDSVARKIGRWCKVMLGRREVPFFPVGSRSPAILESKIPVSLRFTLGILRHWRACTSGCDLLDFHKIESALPFWFDRRPKNSFVHQDIEVIHRNQADIKWRVVPGLFGAVESRVLPNMTSVFCVRQTSVDFYRSRYPHLASRFRLISTYVDPDFYFRAAGLEKLALRRRLGIRFGIRPDDTVLVAVGRLAREKNPVLMIDSVKELARNRPNVRLLMVGDGPMRGQVEQAVKDRNLQEHVLIIGLKEAAEVGEVLRMSDLYVMTSVYEGMPISVLEAMSCGLPIVSTDVGELRRVIVTPRVGRLVQSHTPSSVAAAITQMLSSVTPETSHECSDLASSYTASNVLAPVFETYRLNAGCALGF